ncbi:MAG: hypothetical protein GXP27_18205 [Planctomycetes bacterium]|nr:hypothetical protein [Planctomycetota bacterium]
MRRTFQPKLVTGDLIEWDTRPLLAELLEGLEQGVPVETLAWEFHGAVADALAAMAHRASQQTGLATVGLSGGVFCNALLTQLVVTRLERLGLKVLIHRQVPPNDGGLALGQAAVAAARRGAGSSK